MEEQLISFETAKLAKEKGFKELCFNYYFEDGVFKENILKTTNGYYGEDVSFEFDELLENWNSEFLTTKNGDRCFGCSKNRGYFETFSAPTQSLLQKWLREKYMIIVTSDPIMGFSFCKYSWNIYIHSNIWRLDKFTAKQFDSYEQALENGLQEALKLIK